MELILDSDESKRIITKGWREGNYWVSYSTVVEREKVEGSFSQRETRTLIIGENVFEEGGGVTPRGLIEVVTNLDVDTVVSHQRVKYAPLPGPIRDNFNMLPPFVRNAYDAPEVRASD